MILHLLRGIFIQAHPERRTVSVPPSWTCPEDWTRLDGRTDNAAVEEPQTKRLQSSQFSQNQGLAAAFLRWSSRDATILLMD